MRAYNIIILILLFLLASCAPVKDIVFEKNYLTKVRDLNFRHESLTCGNMTFDRQDLIMFIVQPYYKIESKRLYYDYSNNFEYTQTVITPFLGIYKDNFMGNWGDYFLKDGRDFPNLNDCTWKVKVTAKIVHSFEGIELRNEVRETFFYFDLATEGEEKVIFSIERWLELVARYDYNKKRVR